MNLYLIDGHHSLCRAYHAIEGLTNLLLSGEYRSIVPQVQV